MQVLDKHAATLIGDVRLKLFNSLVLLRNRGMLDPVELISLSFRLFRVHDKALRSALYEHITQDIRNINKKNTHVKLNKKVQRLVVEMMDDVSDAASKKALKVMIDMYKKRVWTDERTVNAISKACFNRLLTNRILALQFFLGIDEQIDSLLIEEEEDELEEQAQNAARTKDKSAKEIMSKDAVMKHSHARLTKKRARRMEKTQKALRKVRQAQAALQMGETVEDFKNHDAETKRQIAVRFPAIELLQDPQEFAERLFREMKVSGFYVVCVDVLPSLLPLV